MTLANVELLAPSDPPPPEVTDLPVTLSVFLEDLGVTLDVTAGGERDELLVTLDVQRSSAPSDLPVTMLVQDGGDFFHVTMDVAGEDLEALVVAPRQRPLAIVEDV